MKVPCLSLWEPWASLLLAGAKVHETRSWAAPRALWGHWFVLHAASRFVAVEPDVAKLCKRFEVWPLEELPRGCAIGFIRLESSFPITGEDWENATDRVAGDWRPGRYAWRFHARQRFEKPVRFPGRQRIWYEDASRFPELEQRLRQGPLP